MAKLPAALNLSTVGDTESSASPAAQTFRDATPCFEWTDSGEWRAGRTLHEQLVEVDVTAVDVQLA